MIELLNVTFIIPIHIEHPDRLRNARTTLGYLNHWFRTNVIVYETAKTDTPQLTFLNEYTNLSIQYIFAIESTFHRTRYLNIMLDLVTTPVVCNYDIDVILPVESYTTACNMIMHNTADVVYPYTRGIHGSVNVYPTFDLDTFRRDNAIAYLHECKCTRAYKAECGHCVFFKTDVYTHGWGENELFISYAPEDKERMHRFITLGYRVHWLPNHKVYHFEHYRGPDSSSSNPHMKANELLFKKIKTFGAAKLREYYRALDYHKKYTKIGK